MTDTGRILVIGGGHNGLVCATYLARAGRKVLLVEAAPQLGGAAITREFAPGFRVSAGAHLLHLLDPAILRDLQLGAHGLTLARSHLQTVSLSEAGMPLMLRGPEFLSGTLESDDRAALSTYWQRMQRFSAVLRKLQTRIPPRLGGAGWRDLLPAAQVALDIRRLGRKDMREFLRVATMSISDVLEETFDSRQLQGALALDGVLGTLLGPRSGNTVLSQLHRMSGEVDGQAGAYAQPRGGMGAVTTALAGAAKAAGVELRVGTPVASILMNGDRIGGIRLENGEEIAGDTVVSNADPKTTLLKLLGARHLEAEFARRVYHLRSKGTAAKLHLALDALPRFMNVAAEQLGERLIVAPDMDYIERAFNPAKYREFSAAPVFEITIPTIHDAALAPAGKHVLSAIVQYAPHDLAGGWDAGRDKLREAALDVLERYSPGLRGSISACEVLTPVDLEREFRMTGGHWHHGELVVDQYMMMRPVLGAAQYAMPVDGLYLCGAGCHPGGGVMGTAGRNAAQAVLAKGRAA